ncbi:MAG TPA: hypothetical protein PKA02_03615 [Candidatus Saccharibacteria bacterium]|nr:hypothetical protein [Candidatus Saccharibacteria bacterium]
MRIEHVPERNELGLVLPPSPDELEYIRYIKPPPRKPNGVERHHLYWPRAIYSSGLSRSFRDHPFNSVWIMHGDHTEMHAAHDGVPRPKHDIMKAFMRKAVMVEEINTCINGIAAIDAAFEEGRVHRVAVVEAHRQEKLQRIYDALERVSRLEAIQCVAADLTVNRAVELVAAA